jgi:hypothetical protein
MESIMPLAIVMLEHGFFAIVIEMALSSVFGWRIYQERFEGKGVKFPIVLVMSLLVAISTPLDLLQGFGLNPEWTVAGKVMTILLLSGGSKIFNDVRERFLSAGV